MSKNDGKIESMNKLMQIILILISAAFTALISYGQDGSLDSTFGTNGIGIYGGTYREETRLTDFTLNTDGSIILVGEYTHVNRPIPDLTRKFTLLKLDPSGNAISGFGQDLTLLNNRSAGANKVVLQPDNKIVAAGFSGLYEDSADFAIVRFLPAGGIDSSFGSYGKVITDFGSNVGEEAVDLLLQNDGKIIAIGNSGGSLTGNSNVVLARYNPDGTLDNSFGVGGKFISFLFPGLSNYVSTATLQKDGRILIGGYTKNGFGFLARLTTNGSLDSSFGVNGVKALDGDQIVSSMRQTNTVQCLKVQDDGKIVICGHWDSTSVSEKIQRGAFVIRFNNGGTFDNTFGSAGKIIFPGAVRNIFDAAYTNNLNALALQKDGKIVAAGGILLLALVRINSDGTFDSTFNKRGFVQTSVNNGGVERVSRVAIAGDGKILSLGLMEGPTYSFLTRHLGGNGVLPVTITFFNAYLFENTVRLNWVTATELNSDQFIVQRSTDGINFKDIAFIAARGLSNRTTDYKYDDIIKKTPGSGIFYYRICTRDKDKKLAFSDVRKVVAHTSEVLTLTKNPVAANALLTFRSLSKEKGFVRIVDREGIVVLFRQIEVFEGLNNIELPTGNLKRGVYELQFSTSNYRKTVPMLKL
jgi:uncharacterized delta-60 repeat protein